MKTLDDPLWFVRDDPHTAKERKALREERKALREALLADKERYDKGAKGLLIDMMRTCIVCDLPFPPWLAERFLAASNKVLSYEVSSWDDVFGRPLKAGKSRKAAHWRHNKGFWLYYRVRELHAADRKTWPISKPLFEKVGAEFGVKATTAENVYREAERRRGKVGF